MHGNLPRDPDKEMDRKDGEMKLLHPKHQLMLEPEDKCPAISSMLNNLLLDNQKLMLLKVPLSNNFLTTSELDSPREEPEV